MTRSCLFLGTALLLIFSSACKSKTSSSKTSEAEVMTPEKQAAQREAYRLLGIEVIGVMARTTGFFENKSPQFDYLSKLLGTKAARYGTRLKAAAALATIMNRSHLDSVKVNFGLGVEKELKEQDVLNYLALDEEDQTLCPNNTGRRFHICRDFSTCSSAFEAFFPFAKSTIPAETLVAKLNEFKADIACMDSSTVQKILLYRADSYLTWVDFYRAFNPDYYATEGLTPAAPAEDIEKLRIQFKALDERFVKEFSDSKHSRFEVSNAVVRDIIADQALKPAGDLLKEDESLIANLKFGASPIQFASPEQRQAMLGDIVKLVEAITGAVTASHEQNVVFNLYLDRLYPSKTDDPEMDKNQLKYQDPRPWFDKVVKSADLYQYWVTTSPDNPERLDKAAIEPRVLAMLMLEFGAVESVLPYRNFWYKALGDIVSKLADDFESKDMVGAYLSLRGRLDSVDMKLRKFTVDDLKLPELFAQEATVAKNFAHFHSIWYSMNRFQISLLALSGSGDKYKKVAETQARDKVALENAQTNFNTSQRAVFTEWIKLACYWHSTGPEKVNFVKSPFQSEENEPEESRCWGTLLYSGIDTGPMVTKTKGKFDLKTMCTARGYANVPSALVLDRNISNWLGREEINKICNKTWVDITTTTIAVVGPAIIFGPLSSWATGRLLTLGARVLPQFAPAAVEAAGAVAFQRTLAAAAGEFIVRVSINGFHMFIENLMFLFWSKLTYKVILDQPMYDPHKSLFENYAHDLFFGTMIFGANNILGRFTMAPRAYLGSLVQKGFVRSIIGEVVAHEVINVTFFTVCPFVESLLEAGLKRTGALFTGASDEEIAKIWEELYKAELENWDNARDPQHLLRTLAMDLTFRAVHHTDPAFQAKAEEYAQQRLSIKIDKMLKTLDRPFSRELPDYYMALGISRFSSPGKIKATIEHYEQEWSASRNKKKSPEEQIIAEEWLARLKEARTVLLNEGSDKNSWIKYQNDWVKVYGDGPTAR